MSVWLFCAAALALSVERISYILIWRHPDRFREWCERVVPARVGGPIDVLAWMFAGFKAIQIVVFLAWHLVLGDGTLKPYSFNGTVVAAGAVLIAAGQTLNFSVFRRLGRAGVFYGNKLGYTVSWCQRFPFTWFEHPQYVGTVLAIWGFFVVMRFPAPDWIVIPMLETAYYALGARLERDAS